MAAEHALTGAGRVHQHRVEALRPPACQTLRHIARHQRVGHAHALHVAAEHLCTPGHRLVAHQQALAQHPPGDLRGLAAGCGAQVKDALPGARVKGRDGHHGAGLLQVVGTRLVQGYRARVRLDGQVAGGGLPGHRSAQPLQRLQRLRGQGLARIEPQRPQVGRLVAAQKSRKLISQLLGHPVHECLRQCVHGHPPPCDEFPVRCPDDDQPGG